MTQSVITAQQTEGRNGTWSAVPDEHDTSMLIYSDKYPQPIARALSYVSPDIGPGRHERDRFAVLIAAAPELLAALKDCVGRFTEAFPAAEGYEPIKAARAAISKATGTP